MSSITHGVEFWGGGNPGFGLTTHKVSCQPSSTSEKPFPAPEIGFHYTNLKK